MKTLSTPKSPLAGMGIGQKIAAIALAALALIALVAVLAGRGGHGGQDASPSSRFTPATYSDGADASSTGHAGHTGGGTGRASSGSSTSSSSHDADPAGSVPIAQLPAEARTTLALIDAGGPFPYARDGVVFSNREHRLPKHPRGWYHEYTVKTPGESDRGTRRLIQGEDGTIYYTGDHYKSFRRVQR